MSIQQYNYITSTNVNDFKKLNSRINDILKYINTPVPVIYTEDINGGKKVHVYCDGKNIKKDVYYGIIANDGSTNKSSPGNVTVINNSFHIEFSIYESTIVTAKIVFSDAEQTILGNTFDANHTSKEISKNIIIENINNVNLIPELKIVKTEYLDKDIYEVLNPWINSDGTVCTKYRLYGPITNHYITTEYETVVDPVTGKESQIEKEVDNTVIENGWNSWSIYTEKLTLTKSQPIQFCNFECKFLGYNGTFTSSLTSFNN